MPEQQLLERANHACELCLSAENVTIYAVPPHAAGDDNHSLVICSTCLAQVEGKEPMDVNHWRCLSSSMWSEFPAVQVVSWRMLNRLRNEDWASDNLDSMYMDDDTLNWAKAVTDEDTAEAEELHRDSNGAVLVTGDSVVITKTLDVKGSSLSAKLGTVVKNIRLVENNTDQIEGRVEGQVIVILTKYVRKQNN